MSTVVLITGCGESNYATIDTVVAGLPTAPNSNVEDYHLLDYNVKEPVSDSIEELESFDFSGPEYKGITEIGNIDASRVSTSDNPPVVCLTTYHTESTGSADNDKEKFICKGPALCDKAFISNVQAFANVCSEKAEDEFTDYTKYYKSPKSKYVNKYIKRAQQIYDAGTYKNATDDTVEIYNSAKELMEQLRDHVRLDSVYGGMIVNGYACTPRDNQAFNLEQAVLSKSQALLESAGYKVITTKNDKSNGVSINVADKEATDNSAVIHIILWARDNSSGIPSTTNSMGTGWLVIYKSDNSKGFAEELTKSLDEKSGINAAFADIQFGSTSQLCSNNANYYTCLNYSGDTPTVLFVIGSYTDQAVSKKLIGTSGQSYAESIVQSVNKLQASDTIQSSTIVFKDVFTKINDKNLTE